MARALFDKILLIINIGFGLALLMSYASMFVSPTFSWYPAFLGLAYPYLLCANICFICYWLARFHANLWISFLIILLGFGLIGRFIQIPFVKPDAKPAPEGSGISMMTYNVRGLYFIDNKGKRVSQDTLLKIISGSSSQIICFQEFPISQSESFANKLSERLGERVYRHSGSADENIMASGNATFSTFPIVGSGKIDLKVASNLCIYTDLKIGSDTLRVYNCHLHSNRIINDDLKFVENMGKIYNSEQINNLKEITAKLKTAYELRSQQVDSISVHIKLSPYRVLVCGDFNDTPVSYTYRKMRSDLSDAFVRAGQWTSSTYQRGLLSFRIDYIFCDSHINVHQYLCKPYVLSDHYPVFCVLNLPAKLVKNDPRNH